MEIEEDRRNKPEANKSRVRVAIRIRPMNTKEEAKEQATCVVGRPGGKLIIGGNRQFKFDSVFTPQTPQERVYKECVQELVMGCFEGYNAAVLAYGQTGSGKTFTMGTSNVGVSEGEQGILPRVIRQLFMEVERRKSKIEFIIKVCFLEIYNEQIIDLLSNDYLVGGHATSTAAIREEKDGSISIYGISQEKVETAEEMMLLLEKGATHRTTSTTLMNDSSSRSHAIFTVFIEQHFIEDLYKTDTQEVDEGFVTAKFHFVDLAGSERIKKTGATGSTLREGININMGLLCLGNVISALTDPATKGNPNKFVPYRDSKLTRILQDSLGGNSNTYMIACVSPAQFNYEESLSTLKYAARAMNIKNSPVVNRDPQSALISQLKQKVFELETENKRIRAMLGQSGIPEELLNLSYRPVNAYEQIQHEEIKHANSQLQHRLSVITAELDAEKSKSSQHQMGLLQASRDRDILRMQIDELIRFNPGMRVNEIGGDRLAVLDVQLETIQSLKSQLLEKERMIGQIQANSERLVAASKRDQEILLAKTQQIYDLKRQIVSMHKSKPTTRQNLPDTSIVMREQETSRAYGHQRAFQEPSRTISDLESQHPIDTGLVPRLAIIGDLSDEQQPELNHDQLYVYNEQQYQHQNKLASMQLQNVSMVIHEKEQQMRDMLNHQTNMEYELIKELRQQYHKKIAGLEKQKERLERDLNVLVHRKDDRVLAVLEKDKTVQALKAKKDGLEAQLKEFRKKQKDQHNLERLVQEQKQRLGDLSKEVKDFKLQKLELNKKLKEDKLKFEKFKADRFKELMQARKATIIKEHELRKLTKQSQKTQQYLLKKEQEAEQMRKANKVLKDFLEPRRPMKRATTFQNSIVQGVNYEHVISRLVQRLEQDISREEDMKKYCEEVDNIEAELSKFLQRDCRLRIDLERQTMEANCKPQQYERVLVLEKCKETSNKLSEMKQVIEGLEQKLEYTRSRYQQTVSGGGGGKLDLDAELLYNRSFDSIETLRSLFRELVACFVRNLGEKRRLHHTTNQLQADVEALNSRIEQLDEQIIRMTTQHQQAVSALRQQVMVMTSYQDQEVLPTIPSSQQLTTSYQQRRNNAEPTADKKYYERQIGELNKKVKQLSMESDQLRKRCDVMTSKYENIKKIGNKDKFIGLSSEDLKITTLKERRTERQSLTPSSSTTLAHLNNSSILLDEVTDMWSGLQNNTSMTNLSRFKQYSMEERRVHTEAEEIKEEANKWECIANFQGHANAVLGMAYVSNCLISTAARNVKMWDLETGKIISDLGGQPLAGYVRSVLVDAERRLMVTACEKVITVWNMVNMAVVMSLKGHKDDVRTLHMTDGVLFSGGKGTGNTPSLLIWDLRSTQPLDEK